MKLSKKYLQWAEQADPSDQAKVGNIYFWGLDGVPVDRLEAFKWTKKAADRGHAESQFCLGSTYATDLPEHHNDIGQQPDYVEAVVRYRLCALLSPPGDPIWYMANQQESELCSDRIPYGRRVSLEERKAAWERADKLFEEIQLTERVKAAFLHMTGGTT